MDSELMAVRAALAERDKTIAELREHVCTLDLEAKDNNTTIAGLVDWCVKARTFIKEVKGFTVDDELPFGTIDYYNMEDLITAIESRPEVKAALEGK